MMTGMRMPKLIMGLLVLAVFLLLLAGCGGAPAGQAGQSAPAQSGGGAAAAKSNVDEKGRFINPVPLEVMATVRSSELAPPGADWMIAKAVKDQLNIDLKMTWVTQSGEFDRLVLTRGAANDLPDVFTTSANLAQNLGDQGLLADWSPYLKYMPTFVQEREVDRLKPIGTYGGKQLALVTKTPDPYKQSVAIRQDWLDKLGLQAPKTLDEYFAVMKAFTEKDPDGNGQKDTYGWSAATDTTGQLLRFEPLFGAFGAIADPGLPWRIEDNKLVFIPTTPERLEALKFINRMNKEGVLDPDWKTQKDSDWRNKWKAGKIGMIYEDWCAGFCAGNHDPFANANPTGRLVDIAPPVGPTGKSAISWWNRTGQRYGMSTRAEQAGKGEAVARLLEWINGPGYLQTIHGEEGKMWKRENGKIVVDQNNDFRIVRALSAWAAKGSDEELRARYDQTTTFKNGQTIPIWEILERAQKNPKIDITELAVLPPAPAEVGADLARLRAEGELQFVTGQRPFSEWDAYVQSLKAAGLDKWQAEAEKRAKEAGLIK